MSPNAWDPNDLTLDQLRALDEESATEAPTDAPPRRYRRTIRHWDRRTPEERSKASRDAWARRRNAKS